MRRHELEHAIRAATTIIRQDRVFIIGSQSILGSFHEDELPEAATMSDEVDICPVHDDDKESLATELDAAIGEFSHFHETHGFYVQGVGQRTAILPSGWTERLISLSNENTRNATGLCLDVNDLCAAKLMANRGKDKVFVSSLVDAGLVDPRKIADRMEMIDLGRFQGAEHEHYVRNLVSSQEWLRSLAG